MLFGGGNEHPGRNVEAMVAYCVVVIIGGGVAAWLTSGGFAGLVVAACAVVGAGGITWLVWRD